VGTVRLNCVKSSGDRSRLSVTWKFFTRAEVADVERDARYQLALHADRELPVGRTMAPARGQVLVVQLAGWLVPNVRSEICPQDPTPFASGFSRSHCGT
jgi:hypothetical protein